MKVAWFSPLPPQRSGVADYCGELLPYLQQYMAIELFVEDPDAHQGTLLAREFPIYSYKTFHERRRSARYDLNIYQMGNDIVHRFVYLTLIDTPGLVVLHEPMLHHFMLQMLEAGWTGDDYSRELDYNYGVNRDDIEAIVAFDGTELSRFRYPMIQRVVDSSLGTIVHSEYASRIVLGHKPSGPVAIVSHAYVPDPETAGLTSVEARRQLGLDEHLFLIGTFGFITPAKRIEAILDALAELVHEAPETRLVLAGGTVPEYSIDDMVVQRHLSGVVIRPGYVSWQDLMRYMIACDMSIALRWPSAGETPGSVIRLLGLGRPTIVSRHKAFAEFPDDICMKVDPATERKDLICHLRSAYKDPDALRAMGKRAGRFIEENYRVEDTAKSYADFCESLARGAPVLTVAETEEQSGAFAVRERIIEDVTDRLAGMGIGPEYSASLAQIAAAVDSMFD